MNQSFQSLRSDYNLARKRVLIAAALEVLAVFVIGFIITFVCIFAS